MEGDKPYNDWRVAGHEWTPSSYGVAAFNLHGEIVTHAETPDIRTIIADCYALNVGPTLVHACTYPDFSIIEFATNKQTWLSSSLCGTRALAVRWPYILAAGGYAEEGDKAVLLLVEAGATRPLKSWSMPFLLGFPDGVALVDGRGEALHVVRDQVWHRWNIDAFLEQIL